MASPTRILNLLFGRPLATSEERAEEIGPLAGIPVFGLDALSSAAYGPEAALTLLIVIGVGGWHAVRAGGIRCRRRRYRRFRRQVRASWKRGGEDSLWR